MPREAAKQLFESVQRMRIHATLDGKVVKITDKPIVVIANKYKIQEMAKDIAYKRGLNHKSKEVARQNWQIWFERK